MARLTNKQHRFCEEYLIDLNGKQAAVRAGYSEATAEQQASRLLSNVKVQEKITELMRERSMRTQITADEVLTEFYSIAKEDIKNFIRFYSENGIVKVEMKDSNTVDTRNISEVSMGANGQFKFKLYGRDSALIQLGRHLGIFEKDNAQLQPRVQMLTDDQFSKIMEKVNK
jgi:phage terminase small subunit